MTLLVQAANISHAPGGNAILDGATFEIRVGDRLALIGANGSGKSTLFRLLARRERPERGTVIHARGITLGLLGQESDLDPATTIREAVALAFGDPAALEAHARELEARMGEAADDDELAAILDAHAEVLERLERGGAADPDGGTEVLAGLGLPPTRWEQRVGSLSGGEKKMVALARLLVAAPDVLLLDEPENHLDFAAKAWLETRVRNHAGAVAVVSHDRWFVDRAANRILELEDGRVATFPGNYADFQRQKRERLERAAALRVQQEREFKKLKASAEQLTQWARQNPKFAPRAENQRRKLAEERERLERTSPPVLERRHIDVAFAAERGSNLMLEATALTKTYGERTVVLPFDLVVRHGERVGLVGANGSGKTTLLRMILGEEAPSGGVLRLGPSVKVGYFAQEHETLDPTATPLDVARTLKPMSEQAAIGFLARFQFGRDSAVNRIDCLSGGERSRLQIAALALQGANFLLLDEPTNNLDVGSIEALEAALLGFLESDMGTILTISHDRAFLDNLCSRIIELDDGVVRDYPGGFAYYDANRGHGVELTRRVEKSGSRAIEKKKGRRPARRS
ncbi:MAG: ABC-F family ATP-binding cassette domain-containing protein [Thermomicrobiales bacterium]|nr:ABC-F family ATP-binding cassette domain-containing protein [Thermomicrobiales bacterium]